MTGTDYYTLVDIGNLGTGAFTRTIDGTGNYTRSNDGPGATLPSNSGTISYHWDQTADPRSGTFSMTQTGTARYDLLEAFHDVSNTQTGKTPGHMNIYPFAQTFVDPDRVYIMWRRQLCGPDSSNSGLLPHHFILVIKEDGTRITYGFDGLWQQNLSADLNCGILYTMEYWPGLTAESVERAFRARKANDNRIGHGGLTNNCWTRARCLLSDAATIRGLDPNEPPKMHVDGTNRYGRVIHARP